MNYIDPVCRKKIKTKQEFAIIKYQDKVYHVCCLACKMLFTKNPEIYIKNNLKK
jgi:YHS domain-containing protein